MGKRDPEQERQTLEWIETVLGKKFHPKDRYDDIIRDGQVLCEVMNTLSPGAIRKVHSTGVEFKMMENINKLVQF